MLTSIAFFCAGWAAASVPDWRLGTPSRLIAEDLDGDGFQDVILATMRTEVGYRNAHTCTDSWTVSVEMPGRIVLVVALGDGQGRFHPVQPPDFADDLHDIAAGDLDGDGRVDLVTATCRSLTFHRGLGDGTFAAGEPLDSEPACALAAGRLRPGHGPELVAATHTGRLTAWAADAAGRLAPRELPGGPDPLGGMVVGDFDGDGLQEPLPLERPGVAAAIDLDGDGADELVSSERGSDALLIRSLRGGAWNDIARYPLPGEPLALGAVDIAGSGRPDLLVSAGGLLLRYADDGARPVFREIVGTDPAPPAPYTRSPPPLAAAVLGADVDGDGDEDLVFATSGLRGSRPGAPTFGLGTVLAQDGALDGPRGLPGLLDAVDLDQIRILVADLDGDPWPDLVGAVSRQSEDPQARLLAWRGSPTGPQPPSMRALPARVSLPDLVLDRTDRQLVSTDQEGSAFRLRLDAEGRFVGEPEVLGGRYHSQTTWALDTDGDGTHEAWLPQSGTLSSPERPERYLFPTSGLSLNHGSSALELSWCRAGRPPGAGWQVSWPRRGSPPLLPVFAELPAPRERLDALLPVRGGTVALAGLDPEGRLYFLRGGRWRRMRTGPVRFSSLLQADLDGDGAAEIVALGRTQILRLSPDGELLEAVDVPETHHAARVPGRGAEPDTLLLGDRHTVRVLSREGGRWLLVDIPPLPPPRSGELDASVDALAALRVGDGPPHLIVFDFARWWAWDPAAAAWHRLAIDDPSGDVVAGDLDGDGDDELLQYSAPRLAIRTIAFDGAALVPGPWRFRPLLPAAFRAVFDQDADGDDDLVLAASGDPILLAIERGGPGGPEGPEPIACPQTPSGAPLLRTPGIELDFDGDGDIDLYRDGILYPGRREHQGPAPLYSALPSP